MKITVYSTATCPFCNMLTDYLKARGVEFVEKKVDQDKQAEQQMSEISGGFLGVPFTVIDKEGIQETIIGFDKNKLNAVLGGE